MLDKIKERLPLITIIIFCLSLIKETAYYWHYGISITEFISLSEVGLLFANTLILLLLFIIIPYIFKILRDEIEVINFTEAANYVKEKFPERFEPRVEKIKTPKSIIHYNKPLNRASTLVLIIADILFLLFFLSALIHYGKPDYKYLYYAIIIGIIGVLMIGYKLVFYSEYRKQRKGLHIVLIALGLIALALIIAHLDISQVDRGKFFGTKIVTNDSSTNHISDKNHYYIGKTDKYLFIYNSTDTSTSIINIQEVKTFDLKEK